MNKFIATIFYIVGTIFTGMGFHKLYAYTNFDASEYPSLAKSNVNVYVGGDAYNYIINMGFATSLFVVALISVVVASTFLILDKIQVKSDMNNKIAKDEFIKNDVSTSETISE